MDVNSLLFGFRPAGEADLHRKALALRSGFGMAQSRGYEGSLEDFLGAAGVVGTHCFGNDGHDSYATTALSVIAAFQPGMDLFLAAVLNDIVVQLNFQSRQVIDGAGGPPEVVVFEGASEYFPVAMVHGNITGGLQVSLTGEPLAMPDWARDNPALEIATGHVIRSHPDHLEQDIEALGRNRIGALLLLPDASWGVVAIAERFASIARFVTKHTVFCIAGGAETILATADQLIAKYPDIQINVRLYEVPVGGAVEYHGIIVAYGIAHLPDINVTSTIGRSTRFVEAMKKGSDVVGASIVNYFVGGTVAYSAGEYGHDTTSSPNSVQVGNSEEAKIRAPFLLSASAPLPDEARGRISDTTELFHSLAVLERGMLIPSQDIDHAIYVHATGRAEIVTDYGDEGRNVVASPLYRESTLNGAGERVGRLKTDRLLHVRGAAMPLMFTPLLHKWYSHFIIQCLPRVQIIRDLGRDIKLLLPADLRPKQLEMLSILGFGEDRIVMMPQGAFVQTDELFVPRAWRLAFSDYSSRIYDEIAAHFDVRTKETPRRILISRESRKTWRNLLNYEAVKTMLVADYGFEVIAPETLTLEEEVATYANAEIVVGAEGAGMYGAVFSQAGTVYLTLCDEDYVMPILGTLAHVRDIDIGYVFGEAMRADADVRRRLPYGHADFVVDIDRVEQAVKSAISKVEANPGR